MLKNEAPFISTQVTSGEYYYLNLTPEKSAKEVVVCGGREQCSPSYRIERNSFRYFSIEFVSSGRGRLTMNGKTYPLRPGAIYCYGPRTKHVIETDPENPMLKHFVDFSGSELVKLMKSTDFSKGEPLFVSRPFRIRSIFENLITTGNTESRNRAALCALLLRQLILQADDYAMEPAAAFSPAWQTYLRCRQYIERNVLELPNIGTAAAACFVDQAYLSRLFKRFAEESPLQLLTRLKMSKAADLLSAGDLLIKQVGEEVGFADPYHFSRVFKRVYGIPPETFTQTARREG
ncbi:Arabinose operon regulatory protein [Pontiella desulfatans]|uniref:Arabinose operon regulatory protein n=1 Tax=Pontiella desulfatans TaxID=2750659 RepID=A0A6C2U497_PONDE|nr:AraC family transcriptional regulator [Pontiella desulfatans]VGO14344.1 Arabinose operon regulatory protein [Pontiella desulfatans]